MILLEKFGAIASMAGAGAMTAIASNTLASPASSVTFSSIPATFTDLYLATYYIGSGGDAYQYLRFNSDSATNYSMISLRTNGTTADSNKLSNANYIQIFGSYPGSTTIPATTYYHINNYANTTNWKNTVAREAGDRNGSGGTQLGIASWRSTSAINSITIYSVTNNYAAGSTFALYGITRKS